MGMKRSKKALLEVIPPRICITFRRASFWYRPKSSKTCFGSGRAENRTNTESGSHHNCLENVQNHEHLSEMDPYSTYRAENQGFWISTVLPIQWDHCRPPKLPYKNQDGAKIQWTPPGKVYTKLFRQPYEIEVLCKATVFTAFLLRERCCCMHCWQAAKLLFHQRVCKILT